MYSLTQLLLRNIVLGIIFSLCITAFSVSFLSNFIDDKTNQHQQMILSVAKQVLVNNDGKVLANILKKNNDYNQLIINTYTGEKLYTYTNSKPDSLPSLLGFSAKQFSNKELNISIRYQLNFSTEITLLIQILLSMFVTMLIFISFSAWANTKKQQVFFQNVNEQIKQDLSLLTSQEQASDSTEDIVDIPELREGIEEIRKIIASKVANSDVLEKEAYVDSLTQLDNRGRFVQFYENQVTQDSPVKFGTLIITRCSELQTINQIHGYHEGDSYISSVAEILKKAISSYTKAELFRLNSSDFACIIPNVQLKEAEQFAIELTNRFNEYQQASDLDSIAYTGLVYFDKSKPLGELLALADTGISVAQTQHINSWYSQKDSDLLKNTGANYGNQNWRQEIDNVIENQRISLLLQPIQPSTRNSKVYGEILARFLNSNDEMLPTASFIAMAEKLDKIVAIDRLIVEGAITEIVNKNLMEQSFGINLSSRTINDEHFLIWLERRLLREPTVSSRLVFEITEYGLQQNIKNSKRFIDMIHRVGSRVTVERFGVGLTSFKFFRDLKPDFIKMDSTYTRDIDDDKNNQYFLRLMVDLAHRLSISVLAESVESQEEKHTLEKLFIDGCQGFYIGKPAPM